MTQNIAEMTGTQLEDERVVGAYQITGWSKMKVAEKRTALAAAVAARAAEVKPLGSALEAYQNRDQSDESLNGIEHGETLTDEDLAAFRDPEPESMGADQYPTHPKAVLPLSGAAVALAAAQYGVDVPGGDQSLPDRLCVNPSSPFFDPIYKRVRVWLNGSERHGDVEEYSISGGWIRARIRGDNGRFKRDDGDGVYRTERLEGEVRVELRPKAFTKADASIEEQQRRIDAAEAKRARKAERMRKQLGSK